MAEVGLEGEDVERCDPEDDALREVHAASFEGLALAEPDTTRELVRSRRVRLAQRRRQYDVVGAGLEQLPWPRDGPGLRQLGVGPGHCGSRVVHQYSLLIDSPGPALAEEPCGGDPIGAGSGTV
jgi:hypothetical protein